MPIQIKSEMMLQIDLTNQLQIMKIQIMNSLVIVHLIYNKQDHLVEEQVPLQEALHLIGVVIIQYKKDMQEVVLQKVGLHLVIKIGLIIEHII